MMQLRQCYLWKINSKYVSTNYYFLPYKFLILINKLVKLLVCIFSALYFVLNRKLNESKINNPLVLFFFFVGKF